MEEQLAKYKLKGTVKIFREEVWGFRNLLPDVSKTIKLFPSYEATLERYIK